MPASLLHEQLALRTYQENMDSPVLEAALVDNGSHFLARDQVIIIYNVEQFIRHNGFP
jgi:hypothetical protein